MLKRLLLGLIKGAVVGGAIGAGLTYGLRWTVASGGLLGFLLAMGAAGTAGVFAGKPPWKEGAWVEALLKGMVGVGIGAFLYWLGSSYAPGPDLSLPGVAAAPWTGLPVVFLPAIAGLYGSLVELDDTDDGADSRGGTAPPRTRVSVDEADALADTQHPASTQPERRARR